MTDVAGTPPSRRRWLIVALTVSVALNLFLLGVIAGHMHHRPPPPLAMRERFERIANRLAMNDTQKQAFQQFEATLRRNGAAMRASNLAAWAKIGDPTVAPDQIAPLLTDAVKTKAQFQQENAALFAKFLATLTPDQRATFVDEARNSGRHRP
jgi:uncharacterized membrane protein